MGINLCLIGMLFHNILGQVIIKTEPNKLVDGESGRVICSVNNNPFAIGLARSDGTLTNCPVSVPSYSCEVNEPGPENNYTDYRPFYTVSKTTTSLTINIDTVSKQRDSGYWRCYVQNPNNEINTTIDVKVPVKGVEIENKYSLNLVNGVSTTMNCKVTNNPDPVVNFRWFIVETNQTLSTSSSLQLTPNKNQNGQTLSCSADNGYGSMKSDTIILNVQYKPSVKLEPEVSGNYKIIDTVELKCIVTDANPNDPSTFRYKWYNDTTTTLPGQVRSTVQISQNGIYTCSVSNGIGTPGISDNTITVEVLFPPRVTVTPNYSIIESNTLTIPCIATSNPLPNSYTWSGPNNFLQSQQNLNIPGINRNQTGLYTCTVTNIMISTTGEQQTGTGTGDTDVIVLFGPEVHVSTNMINILESDKLVVNCSVSQSKLDDASINWYKPDGTRISGNILSIDNIRREEDGIYSCNSSKVLTPSTGTTKTNVDSKTTRVNVLYLDPVIIIRDILDNIQEGDKINITCTTQSNPTASITYRNGTDVIQTDFSNKASFIKLSATCLDTGVYSCQVNNSNIPQTSYNDTIQIHVNCSPREDSRINHQYKITGNVGENVELTAQVISYPRPIFQWYYRENNVDIPIINNGSFQQTDRSININTFLSKLTIHITSNKFYRRYYVNVSNEVNPGGYDLQYDITAENVPDRPNNITYINETSNTICVEWTPGFNGGASQSFIVQHSTDDKTWVNSSTIPDRTNNGRVDYCIEGLEPDTSYYIRVIARNKYGESLISTLSMSEPHKTAPRKGNSSNVSGAGIGTGIGIALAILAIVLIAVFLYKYRQGKQKTPEQTYDSVDFRAAADAQTYQELNIVPTTSNTESPQNDDAVRYYNLGPSQNATNRQVDDTTPYANLKPTTGQNATNRQVDDTRPYASLQPTV